MSSFFDAVGRLLGFKSAQPMATKGPFTPSYKDVCEARALLNALRLPTELALQVLDHAEYFPQHVFDAISQKVTVANAGARRARGHAAAALCLDVSIFDTLPAHSIRMGGEKVKISSVEFEPTSEDQGWTSEDTIGIYSTSSWLEVSIMRSKKGSNTPPPNPHTHWPNAQYPDFMADDPSEYHRYIADHGWHLVKRPEAAKQGPQDDEGDFGWYLQGNRVASGRNKYRIVWGENGSEGNEGAGSGMGFLEELTEGDHILVWARSKVSYLNPNSKGYAYPGSGKVGSALWKASRSPFSTALEATSPRDELKTRSILCCHVYIAQRIVDNNTCQYSACWSAIVDSTTLKYLVSRYGPLSLTALAESLASLSITKTKQSLGVD
jgi:hypothetical protein